MYRNMIEAENVEKMKIKFLLIHPYSNPCLRNRAVFQRPLWMSKKSDLEIWTTEEAEICEDILKETIVKTFPAGKFPLFKNMIWKIHIFIALIRLRRRAKHKERFVYIFPQWGFLFPLFINMIGFKVIADIQHSPMYYLEYGKSQPSNLARRTYYLALGFIWYFGAKISLNKLHFIVAMSHGLDTGFGKILIEKFNVSRRKLLAIPNGVSVKDGEKFIKKYKKKEKDNQIGIVYAGNIQYTKIEPVFDIFAELNKSYPIKLYIAGNVAKSYETEFRNRINKEPFSNFIKYLGFIDHTELQKLYILCDFGLFIVDKQFTDHKHSHPGKVFEYMLYGCVPVVSRIPSMEKIIVDRKSGILIDNIKDLSEKIEPLLSDIDMRKEYKKNAKKAVKEFDWEKLNDIWFEAISNI
jgi:glycosyltransferase involved in cell wall biosynthesis